MSAAAGSVWNANSWHWEEKSYTKWSREYLQARLGSLKLVEDVDGFSVTTLPTPAVSGEASVSVRKGKTILAVDMAVKLQFEAQLKQDGNRKCRGEISVTDISSESVEDRDYTTSARLTDVDLPAAEAMTAEERQQALAIVKRNGMNAVHAALERFIKDLQEAESNSERLQADKAQREAELQRMQVAEKEKGEEKKAIAEQQKRMDSEMKERARQRAAAQPAPPSQPAQVEGQGSVWNANSYHWEEKPMTRWCRSTLEERFNSAELSLLDGSTTLKFFNVKVDGEASNTIRKGKKLVIFDLTIGADWTATARDEAGVFLADSRGRLDVRDFSSETLDDYEVTIQGDGKVPPQQRIDTAAKTELPEKIKDLLSKFVDDLRARG
ncbi:activator of hsp90 atpase, n-terminal protein [Toxoplasma gondii TgCatPRC2]|uniref:Activator of hsp90 atpase, n-terminal protein n=7 Tax=Toxoplasma gondii TaxID=5811 RepID=A0A151H3B4_TOXGO|nr:activator of hsp90 ATPase, putative [Toxoplasma gondii ME49]EPR58305.1 putative activator of hsp90 ATPase [Toxoplasma gondii GT1]KAF4645092.1 putative activator of hsp90 ATPase [Toxoplasma gondii]KFG57905.1 activator of hsp90 atpase, n-terminal protein [Toxoplasma gondii RUB]KFH08223.1 activator of hsp90 atpase, n-terminal protein [Toxoplasma gondii MAS]KYF39411.1 activator of hsp90 atpase, n-terminal protein [Toxoplasma gondii ARI]KYK63829.1 activator of hsp90 atpase, n-terminal protein [|eukprot:XP_002371235.1 activator of hsp90 ATPase, putative [Toxoplasma gondii ME49]